MGTLPKISSSLTPELPDPMNVDDPKLTAYALGELSGDEETRLAAEVADSPEAERMVGETRNLAQMLQGEYETERAATAKASANLIDIRGDRWFWGIARPLSIAAVLALFAVVGAVALLPQYRNQSRVAG